MEQELVVRWAQLHADGNGAGDADRQLWFSEAAAFLQSTEHWWCQHTSLTEHFAEIFVYHTQPVVQRLWDIALKQLSTCALCVVNYHSAQVNKLCVDLYWRIWSYSSPAANARMYAGTVSAVLC